MPQNIIYHNPRCSKSRQTLRILQERGAEVEVIEYLKTPPGKEDLDFICTQLGIEPVEYFVRKHYFRLFVHGKRFEL